VGLALVKNHEIILKNPIMEKLLPDLENRISTDTPDYYHENIRTNDKNISLTFLRVSDDELIVVAEDFDGYYKHERSYGASRTPGCLG